MEKYLNRTNIPVYVHDFEKDIGLPEHLEVIADEAAERIPSGMDFDIFVNGLRTVSCIGGERLVDIASQREFRAWVDDNQALFIEDANRTWEFDTEDLHGAWVSLLRGLVTRDRVEWSTRRGREFRDHAFELAPKYATRRNSARA